MSDKKKVTSPRLKLELTEENHRRAVNSSSGGCLIADAIKDQYPNLSSISVDMATIRVSDKAKGYRYIYLTPPAAQTALLAFDQGWPSSIEQVTLNAAVQIVPIKRSGVGPASKAAVKARREGRLAAAEAKLTQGEELSPSERRQLTKDKAALAAPPPDRPNTHGAAEVDDKGTVIGGHPPAASPDNPNLLRGRNRLFGAKTAKPSEAFVVAVDDAVERELARRDSEGQQVTVEE